MEGRLAVVQQDHFFGDMPADVVALICYLLIPGDIESLLRACKTTHSIILTLNIPVIRKLWEAKLALHFPHADTYDLKTAEQFHQALGNYYQVQLPNVATNQSRFPRESLPYLLSLPSDPKKKLHLKRLFAAAKEGDVETLELIAAIHEKSDRYLHELQSYALQKDTDQHTFLFYARKYHNLAWLDHFNRIVLSRSMPTVLHIDVSGNSRELQLIADMLVTRESLTIIQLAVADFQSQGRWNPETEEQILHLAALYGHTAFVKWYLEVKPQLKRNIKIMHNNSALVAHEKFLLRDALQSHNEELVSFLFDECEESDGSDRFALTDAMDMGEISLVNLVLRKRPQLLDDVTLASSAITHLAFISPHGIHPHIHDSRVFKLFYDKASLTKDEIRELLIRAANNCNVAYIREFYRRHPDYFDKYFQKALLICFIENYRRRQERLNTSDVVYMINLCKESVSETGELLYRSMMIDFPFEAIKCLIDAGEGVGYKSDSGYNLFHIIVRCNYYQGVNVGPLIKLLVEKGVDIEQSISYGDTPLTKAWATLNINIAKALVEQGARVDHLIMEGFKIAPLGYRGPTRTLLFRLSKEITDVYLQTQVKDETKREILSLLFDYIYNRSTNHSEYTSQFFFIKFGCSKTQKLAAADALIRVLVHGESVAILDAHQEALKQGRLGKLFNSPDMQRLLGLSIVQQDIPRPRRAQL